MIPAAWRFALASVVGTSHLRQDLGCQDASDCRVLETADGAPVLVAIASDGAGSASRAEIGSRLACSLFMEETAALLADGGAVEHITRGFAQEWIARFQCEVGFLAAAEALATREFACTVLAAVVGGECAAFLQIGDGAIIVGSESAPEYDWVFWPQKGEYENMTSFATDAAAGERLEYTLVEGSIEELALFTDGLQRLALHFGSRKAHTPFFGPMFAPVRAATEGYSATLSSALAAYLALPRINARTDDDKTLILATRRVMVPEADDGL
jgi:hypothetical protein